mmetsp:Transcript_20357/g.57737  ORF Transcript_20357/g.57737 Transcript_20357/m.57737 type:complete len:260 (-) Transcript_20357:128-907(-)
MSRSCVLGPLSINFAATEQIVPMQNALANFVGLMTAKGMNCKASPKNSVETPNRMTYHRNRCVRVRPHSWRSSVASLKDPANLLPVSDAKDDILSNRDAFSSPSCGGCEAHHDAGCSPLSSSTVGFSTSCAGGVKAVESCRPRFEASSAIRVRADAVASSSFARCGDKFSRAVAVSSSDFCLASAARAAAASRPRCVADAIESHDGSSELSNGFQPPMAFVGGLARPSSAMAVFCAAAPRRWLARVTPGAARTEPRRTS